MAYEKLGEKQKAIEAYQRAVNLDPGNATAREGLRRLGR
jgi:Tfp pilus assembly protein PilF